MTSNTEYEYLENAFKELIVTYQTLLVKHLQTLRKESNQHFSIGEMTSNTEDLENAFKKLIVNITS